MDVMCVVVMVGGMVGDDVDGGIGYVEFLCQYGFGYIGYVDQIDVVVFELIDFSCCFEVWFLCCGINVVDFDFDIQLFVGVFDMLVQFLIVGFGEIDMCYWCIIVVEVGGFVFLGVVDDLIWQDDIVWLQVVLDIVD